jgi:hypothetical protein
MKQTPMIFNQEMVKALIEGRKVATRRPVAEWQLPVATKDDTVEFEDLRYMSVASNHRRWGFGVFGSTPEKAMQNYNDEFKSCSPYKAGDLIWVRETFEVEENTYHDLHGQYCIVYRADKGVNLVNPTVDNNDYLANSVLKKGFTPSIHMPKHASRLTLKVTNVRVEQIQNLSDDEAVKEGMPSINEAQDMALKSGMNWYQNPSIWFKGLWDRLYGNWNKNPWVWVIEFEVIHKNINEVTKQKLA